jgi:multidrug efflux pump subunit AcrA (membrane-fusion protein)
LDFVFVLPGMFLAHFYRRAMSNYKTKWLWWGIRALVLGVVALLVWQRYGVKREDSSASGNGRIEATEIDVTAKIPGRVKEVLAREGDFVTAGQVGALMDTDTLQAQLHDVIRRARACGRKVGLCGQAPSDYPVFAHFLVTCGINSISLNPNTVLKTTQDIVARERQRAAQEKRAA